MIFSTVMCVTFFDPKTNEEVVVPFSHRPLGIHIHKIESRALGDGSTKKTIPYGGKVTQVSKNPAKALGVPKSFEFKNNFFALKFRIHLD